MTTNGDMAPRRPDEDEPIEQLLGDVLDLVDESVERITDAEVSEHLREVLGLAGYIGTERGVMDAQSAEAARIQVPADKAVRDLRADHGAELTSFVLEKAELEAARIRREAELELVNARHQAELELVNARHQAELAAQRMELDEQRKKVAGEPRARERRRHGLWGWMHGIISAPLLTLVLLTVIGSAGALSQSMPLVSAVFAGAAAFIAFIYGTATLLSALQLAYSRSPERRGGAEIALRLLLGSIGIQVSTSAADHWQREHEERLAAMAREIAVEDRDAQWAREDRKTEMESRRAQLELERQTTVQRRRVEMEGNIKLLQMFVERGHLDAHYEDIGDLISRIRGEVSTGRDGAAGEQDARAQGEAR